jgi:hypothetical protein
MTEADRLLLLALDAYERNLCVCGEPRDEAWSLEHDRANPNHTAYYDARPPFVCAACSVLDAKHKAYADAGGSTAGRFWAVAPVPRGLALA